MHSSYWKWNINNLSHFIFNLDIFYNYATQLMERLNDGRLRHTMLAMIIFWECVTVIDWSTFPLFEIWKEPLLEHNNWSPNSFFWFLLAWCVTVSFLVTHTSHVFFFHWQLFSVILKIINCDPLSDLSAWNIKWMYVSECLFLHR